LLQHHRDGTTRGVHRPEQIHREQALDLSIVALRQHFGQRDARIAEENVQRAVALDAEIERSLVVLAATHVTAEEASGSTAFLHFANDVRAFGVLYVDQYKACALLGETKRARAPDTRARAGDDCCLPE